MISIQDKIAQMLACDSTRGELETYRSEFDQEHENDTGYYDVFSGSIYKDLKEKGLFTNSHDIFIGLCIDGFSTKQGNQSLVMIYVIIFSLDPSIR